MRKHYLPAVLPYRMRPAGCHALISLAGSRDRLASAVVATISAASCSAVPGWSSLLITPGSTPAAPVDSPGLGTGGNFALLSGEAG
jgi:hypothetical protein